jgi:hypothetical protein
MKMELFRLGDRMLRVHPASQCAGQESCCIHKPSDHVMRDFPMHWREDRGLMERICPHGVGHPDPDHMAHVERTQGREAADTEYVHGCDGCCGGTYDYGAYSENPQEQPDDSIR